MKNKKKRLVLVTTLFSAALCAMAVVMTNHNSRSLDEMTAEHQKYSITLDASNKISSSEKSSFTRNTAMGNPIAFTAGSFNDRSEAQWFGQLASGTSSHLENSTLISGIETITIKSQFKAANGGYMISAGVTAGDLSVSYTHTSSATEGSIVTNTFNFSGEVNYFKISNLGTNCGTYINEIKIVYSCVAADGTRDAKEKASGDLLYGALLDSSTPFTGEGKSADIRCTSDVSNANSGYSFKFMQTANPSAGQGWPNVMVELGKTLDFRGYDISLDVKFTNCHNWFAFNLYNENQEKIFNKNKDVDTTKDLGNWVSATIKSAEFPAYADGKSAADLASVKYIKFAFNFDESKFIGTAPSVVIDNVQLIRGKSYDRKVDQTYEECALGKQYVKTDLPFAAFDIKFNNPTVHQEVGVCLEQGSWGLNFGVDWFDIDETHGGEPYWEAGHTGLTLIKLSDGYYRLYVDPSKFDIGESGKPEYISHIYIKGPSNASNGGTGFIDVSPVGRVYAPIETIGLNQAFVSTEDMTISFPTVFNRGSGKIIAEFTFNDANKAAVSVGNWTHYNGYFNIYGSSDGTLYDGVEAQNIGTNITRVVFNLKTMTKYDNDPGSASTPVDYKFIYIRKGWTESSGTVSVYHQY